MICLAMLLSGDAIDLRLVRLISINENLRGLRFH
jgi:hypothetical protein